MAKYKYTDASFGQGLFLTVNLERQVLSGTFEYMLNDLLGKEIDISTFDANYKNDTTGATAIPPAVLIKLIIYGYRKGIISSRKLGELAETNIIAKSLTENMEPHWTTIAAFVSKNSKKLEEIFKKVLMYCNELELIGGEDFAVDGLRLPSNASIDMSGTEEELEKRLEMYRRMAEKHIAKHRRTDEQPEMDEETKRRYDERQKHLTREKERLSNFLAIMEKKEGKHVDEIKSNVTDNDSAMIYSGGDFIQGYVGIAVADKKNQIIVNAEAFGTANEGEHLPGLIDKTLENLDAVGVKEPSGKQRVFMGDANYFSEDNLQACQERDVEAIIPDGQDKRRLNSEGEPRFNINDFQYNAESNTFTCPQGKCMKHQRTTIQNGIEGEVYQASLTDCKVCPSFTKCSWSRKKQSEINKGKVIRVTEQNKPDSLSQKMRAKLSTQEYKDKYSYRIGIIEPVFANISYCKGLNRFTLRGKTKVNGQWLLYCMVHNLGKCLKGYNERRKTA
jgi:transposase